MNRKKLYTIVILGFMLAILFPNRAPAVTSDTIGVGARAIGLGGAYTAVASDPTALYYNPAGLTFQRGNHISLGYMYGYPNLKEDGTRVDMFTEKKIQIEASWVFSGKLKDRAGIGLQIFMPQGSVYKLKQHDPYEGYFPMYENQAQSFEMRFGAAFRPFPRVSLGFAAMLLASLDGTLWLYTPFQFKGMEDPNQRMLMTMDQDLPNKNYYYAGILADLGKGFKAGFAYRDENYVEVHLPLIFETTTPLFPLPVGADSIMLTKYSPWRISAGLSYEKEEKYLLAFSLDYVRYRACCATLSWRFSTHPDH